MQLWKKLALVLLVVALAGTAFVLFQAAAFDASIEKVYAIAPLDMHALQDPAVIARGKHLAQSIGGCIECHGHDLGGKPGEDIGPLGDVPAPNLTSGRGGVASRYTDGELARLLRHGVRASGQSLRFMPAQDTSWWPDDDLRALISYLRTLPPVDRTSGKTHIGLLGKVLDRLDALPLDVARRIDHTATRPQTLPAQPTAEYGALLARSCSGCHGEHYSGGPIPGAPSDLPIPANLTPHATGMAGCHGSRLESTARSRHQARRQASECVHADRQFARNERDRAQRIVEIPRVFAPSPLRRALSGLRARPSWDTPRDEVSRERRAGSRRI